MIQQLEVNGESNKYRPDVLCPEFFAADRDNNPPWKLRTPLVAAIEKEYNIKAVETYALKLCDNLAAAARVQHEKKKQLATPEVSSSSSVLKDYVKLNLEKIAAKSFNPSFLEQNNKPKSFASFVEQAKQRTEKYADPNKEPIIFVEHPKYDQHKYQELVQARLSVYKGWEFIERTDGQEGFILRNNIEADANKTLEITVTKKAKNSFNIVSTGTEINDDTIAIMLELSHNLIRFSDKPMKMTIQGAEANNVGEKIEEGLAIINKNKPDQHRIHYKFDNRRDNK